MHDQEPKALTAAEVAALQALWDSDPEFTWCWIMWKGALQEQPWEYVERTGVTGRRWWHDDLSLNVSGGVTHWMPCRPPAPPARKGE